MWNGNDFVKALGRLTERESYDRAYRHRLASMASISHAVLPKAQWVPKEAVRVFHVIPSIFNELICSYSFLGHSLPRSPGQGSGS